MNRVKPYLAELQSRSRQRLETDKDYAYVREDITEFRKVQADKSLSLNEAGRRAEQKSQMARLETRKKERLSRKKSDEKVFEITLKNVDLTDLQPPVVKTNSVPKPALTDADDDGEGASSDEASIDPPLNETKRILADYIELLKKGPAISKAP